MKIKYILISLAIVLVFLACCVGVALFVGTFPVLGLCIIGVGMIIVLTRWVYKGAFKNGN